MDSEGILSGQFEPLNNAVGAENILRKGEANLSKKCVVNTTQIKSVDKRSIKEKVGTLSKKRMDEVHEGLKIVTGMP